MIVPHSSVLTSFCLYSVRLTKKKIGGKYAILFANHYYPMVPMDKAIFMAFILQSIFILCNTKIQFNSIRLEYNYHIINKTKFVIEKNINIDPESKYCFYPFIVWFGILFSNGMKLTKTNPFIELLSFNGCYIVF